MHLLTLVGQMLEELSVQIRFRAATVYELLDYLSESVGELEFLCFARAELAAGESFYCAWEKGLSLWQNTALHDEDRALLLSIGAKLGDSDVEGQLSTIELHKQHLSALLLIATEQRQKKGKLYRSMGVLGGVFIAIMLI